MRLNKSTSIRSKLFKFRPLDMYAIDCLVKQRLFLTPWKQLNDANEAQMFVRGYGANCHMNPDRLRQTFPEFLSFDAQHVRVCCLSRVWSSNLLWSHYADGHTGVAIGVLLPGDLSPIEQISVKYDDALPSFPAPIEKGSVLEALKHKSPEWEYEQETRLISSEEGNDFINDIEIVDVVFGLRTPNDAISLVNDLVPDNVSLWRICRKPGSYSLNAEDVCQFI